MSASEQRPHPLDAYRRVHARRRQLDAALRVRQTHAVGTWVILAVNVAIYAAMAIAAGGIRPFSSRLLISWGALFAPNVATGEWWRLFTATFLHVNPLHLTFNMIALAMVGPVVERLVGIRTFLIFYIACSLVGSSLSLWVHPLTPSAGASGAILGVYGVLLAVTFDRASVTPLTLEEQVPFVSRELLRVHLQPAVGMIAGTLLFGWFDPRADNAAHIGGFAAGFLFGWLGGRHIAWGLPTMLNSVAAVVVALVACAVSLAIQREINDARLKLIEVFTLDSRATAQYSALVKSRTDPGTITRTIEQDILPAFSHERARLESIGGIPAGQQRILADLRQYVWLRESYWRQRAAASDRTDDATRQQLDAADHASDAVMRRLLDTR